MSQLYGKDTKWHPLSECNSHVFHDCFFLFVCLFVQEDEAKAAAEFVDSLAKTSENLLLEFDGILTVDDVEKGRKTGKKMLKKIFYLNFIVNANYNPEVTQSRSK